MDKSPVIDQNSADSDSQSTDSISVLKQRNVDLREQLDIKVKIFEQYIVVAKLQSEKNLLRD